MVRNFDFKDRDGSTPLTKEQTKGLKHDITTQGELDELEEENITMGLAWLEKTNLDFAKYDFWKKAHQRHFGDVWSWAGEIRQEQLANPDFTEPGNISVELHKLEEDLKTWLDFASYCPEDFLAQFHLRLITIHPFPNGNGRITRILTEHFARKLSYPVPTWGQKLSAKPKERRRLYIHAIDNARHHNQLSELVEFMFS